MKNIAKKVFPITLVANPLLVFVCICYGPKSNNRYKFDTLTLNTYVSFIDTWNHTNSLAKLYPKPWTCWSFFQKLKWLQKKNPNA